MAENQNVNKVVYGDNTLIDLTNDTVTPSSLLSGETAHDRSGAQIIGSMVAGDVNIIESISLNGVNVAPDANKNVALVEADPTVPSWAKQNTKPSYTAAEVGAKATQTAVSDPTASGTSLTFIDTISQNTQGVISPTKKTVSSATQSAAGLMSAADKKKLDGIATGAQVNSITGVKGNAEDSYRTGNVNLTPANIGVDKTSVIYQISRGSSFDPIQSGYWAGMTSQSGIDSNWWHVLSMDWSGNDTNNWLSQLAIPTDKRNGIYYRTRQNSTTNAWVKCLDANNYTDYTVTKTGSGASGTWGIGISGNAATATKLLTARNINGTSFDGSAAITTANWGTARNITIKDASSTNAGTAVSVNGSAAITLLLPSTIKASITGNCSGNAANVTGTVAVDHGGTGATTAANARKNLNILSGSNVINFSNGYGTMTFSNVGVSSKPTTFVATASNVSCIMRYDYDDTNASNGPIKLYCIQPNGAGFNGNVRISWICIP